MRFRNLSNTPTFLLALLLTSLICALNVSLSSMFTPKIVILSEDLTILESISSDTSSTHSSVFEDFG